MKLTKKNLTKLLNSSYRASVLRSFKANSPAKEKIDAEMDAYARYLSDSQIIDRDKAYEKDPKSYYGFSPIQFICGIREDGTIAKMLTEMNIVNHFLKDQDGNSAVEVLKCILIMWLQNSKEIVSFDVDKIDAELVKLEAEMKKQKKEQQDAKEADSKPDSVQEAV